MCHEILSRANLLGKTTPVWVPSKLTTVDNRSYLRAFVVPESKLECVVPEHLASFIDGLVTAWYSEVARWQPPGGALGNDCVLCVTSEVPDLLRLREWPHSATHSLVVDLVSAAGQAASLLTEVGHQTSVPEAHELFRACIAAHAADVNDVLLQCVEPRFSRYVAEQAEMGVRELEVLLGREAARKSRE